MSNVVPLRSADFDPIVPALSPAHLAPLRENLALLLDMVGDNLELFGGAIADMAGLTSIEASHDPVP